jgi:glycolate oxidase FAD binding subunit
VTRQNANRRFQPPENVRASRENAAFADEVGADGPVRAVGGETQVAAPVGVRLVRAPIGVVEFEPAEMTVRVRAGTTVADLQQVLAERGQRVLVPSWGAGSTVGGVLATGRSDIHRLGWGPTRDRVLELRYVDAAGHLVKAGGPTVKNVSGFDLCRLHVGAHGTLGLLAEAVLRTHPVPAARQWWRGSGDPWKARASLHRPTSVLWDGAHAWVLLEGHRRDVDDQGQVLRAQGFEPTEAAPAPSGHRWSVDPAGLAQLCASGDLGGPFVAEIGVGTVHATRPQPDVPTPDGIRRLNDRVRARFDPTGRFTAPVATPAGAA